MNTSENMNQAIISKLPTLPEGFDWRITTSQSSVEASVTQTRLWLERNNGETIVSWANIQKNGKWIQNPTLDQLMIHAEGILAKTSNRWVLDLPTAIEKPDFM